MLLRIAPIKHNVATVPMNTFLEIALLNVRFAAPTAKVIIHRRPTTQHSTKLNVQFCVSRSSKEPPSSTTMASCLRQTGMQNNDSATLTVLNLNIGHMNAHSLRLYLYDVRSEMLKNKLHVLGICESHLEPSIASSHVEIPAYKYFRNDRNSSRAKGGVAVYVHESIAAKVLFRSVQPAKYINVPEIILIELHFDRFKILCGTVYSPPKAGQWSDVEEALSLCTGSYDLTLLMSDFNIEWHSNCSPRRILYEFLDNFELERLPFGTTHHQEFTDTTIDYICVSDLTKVISFDQKHVPHISKHDFLWTPLAFTVPPTASSTITRRY